MMRWNAIVFMLALVAFLSLGAGAYAQGFGFGWSAGGTSGWLPTTSSEFSVKNNITNSNTFTNWTQAENTSAITVTAGATDPLGGTTATAVTIPTVSGTGKFAVIDLTTTGLAQYPLQFVFWAQVTSGSTNGTLYATMSVSTSFVRTAIPADGAWHKIVVDVPVHTFTSGNPAPQIGVNLVDTSQSATTGPITVNLWQAAIVNENMGPYISESNVTNLTTTTSLAAGVLTLPLPSGVAFRDFSGLTPSASNPIISENTSNPYESGGVSNPYVENGIQFGGKYWGFSNATSSATHGDWMSYALWSSTDGIHWTEDTTNAPYLQTFGSQFSEPTIFAGGTGYDTGTIASGTLTWTGANCPVNPVLNATTNGSGVIASATLASGSCAIWPTSSATTWTPGGGLAAGSGVKFTFASVRGTGTISYWQLHPAWLPYGCNVSGTAYSFCVLLSGREPGTSTPQVYLAYSTTVDGVYTVYGCPSGTCAAPTPVIPATNPPGAPGGVTSNELVTVVNIGGSTGTNYIFTNNLAEAANNSTMEWSTPANSRTSGAGTTITWLDTALPVTVSGVDWDYNANYEDSQVFLNSCGFYEYFYTAFAANIGGSGISQVIGYAVSNSLSGPWWKFTGQIIPSNSSMYGGTGFIGDSSILDIGGNFIWLGNFDNGTNLSRAVAATMPDVTGCPG